MSMAYEPIMGRNTGLSTIGITCVTIAAGCSAAGIGRPSAGIGRAITGEMNVGNAGGESWASVADTRTQIRDVRFTIKRGNDQSRHQFLLSAMCGHQIASDRSLESPPRVHISP